ncbi:hypothetical protein HDU96_009642 [Phlyctochytrium bullatum]|nr:hypothetical protein HDU96_009642 [Phlyctochytrium bullatum]
MDSLPSEVLKEVVIHLDLDEIHLLAAVCARLRQALGLEFLSFSFAKEHLEVIARLAAEGYGPFQGSWLHFVDTAGFDHPLLFNYGLAAVALHGFSFDRHAHLAMLMLGSEWIDKLTDPDALKRRNRRIELLATAFRMGLWNLDSLPAPVRTSPHFAYDCRRISTPVLDAFVLAVLCQCTDLANAIARRELWYLREGLPLEKAFSAAAAYGSLDMIKTILSTLGLRSRNLESFEGRFHSPLLEACVLHDFPDFIASLPDHYIGFNSIILSRGISVLAYAACLNRKNLVDLMLQKHAMMTPDVLFTAVGTPLRAPVEMVRHLLVCGSDPNAQDRQGRLPLLEAMGGYGPDRNALPARPHPWARPLPPSLPIDEEAQVSMNMVELLLAGGANPNAADSSGGKPLLAACRSNTPGLVAMLLDAGADPENVSRNGWTLLHAATAMATEHWSSRDTLMIQVVLRRFPGMVDRRDTCGRTPLDMAVAARGKAPGATKAEALLRAAKLASMMGGPAF